MLAVLPLQVLGISLSMDSNQMPEKINTGFVAQTHGNMSHKYWSSITIMEISATNTGFLSRMHKNINHLLLPPILQELKQG